MRNVVEKHPEMCHDGYEVGGKTYLYMSKEKGLFSSTYLYEARARRYAYVHEDKVWNGKIVKSIAEAIDNLLTWHTLPLLVAVLAYLSAVSLFLTAYCSSEFQYFGTLTGDWYDRVATATTAVYYAATWACSYLIIEELECKPIQKRLAEWKEEGVIPRALRWIAEKHRALS